MLMQQDGTNGWVIQQERSGLQCRWTAAAATQATRVWHHRAAPPRPLASLLVLEREIVRV